MSPKRWTPDEDAVIRQLYGKVPVKQIAERLGLDKQSERNAVSAICNEPGLRIYGKSFEVGGPVKAGRNPAAVIRP